MAYLYVSVEKCRRLSNKCSDLYNTLTTNVATMKELLPSAYTYSHSATRFKYESEFDSDLKKYVKVKKPYTENYDSQFKSYTAARNDAITRCNNIISTCKKLKKIGEFYSAVCSAVDTFENGNVDIRNTKYGKSTTRDSRNVAIDFDGESGEFSIIIQDEFGNPTTIAELVNSFYTEVSISMDNTVKVFLDYANANGLDIDDENTIKKFLDAKIVDRDDGVNAVVGTAKSAIGMGLLGIATMNVGAYVSNARNSGVMAVASKQDIENVNRQSLRMSADASEEEYNEVLRQRRTSMGYDADGGNFTTGARFASQNDESSVNATLTQKAMVAPAAQAAYVIEPAPEDALLAPVDENGMVIKNQEEVNALELENINPSVNVKAGGDNPTPTNVLGEQLDNPAPTPEPEPEPITPGDPTVEVIEPAIPEPPVEIPSEPDPVEVPDEPITDPVEVPEEPNPGPGNKPTPNQPTDPTMDNNGVIKIPENQNNVPERIEPQQEKVPTDIKEQREAIDNLARERLETRDPEQIATRIQDVSQRADELFDSREFNDDLKNELKSYGYNDSEVQEIMKDRGYTRAAILEADKRRELTTVAEEIAKEKGITNYDTSYDDGQKIDDIRSGNSEAFISNPHNDPEVKKAYTTYTQSKETLNHSIEKANEAIKDYNSKKKDFEDIKQSIVTNSGTDTSEWSSEDITRYNKAANAYTDSYNVAKTKISQVDENQQNFDKAEVVYTKEKDRFNQDSKNRFLIDQANNNPDRENNNPPTRGPEIGEPQPPVQDDFKSDGDIGISNDDIMSGLLGI